MKRHYFSSNSLADLEAVERELEEAGITSPQLHVLSLDDAGAERHGLHTVEAVLKKDVVRGTARGAAIGIVVAGMVLAAAYLTGITEPTTWVPPTFLAIVALGFCTWEGGLIGIQEPHVDFRRFEKELAQGRHIFFVDIDPEQEGALGAVAANHPMLTPAGQGEATPKLVIQGRNAFDRVMKVAP